ncbi:MAG: glycosyltransferase [Bacteroidota bacterium]
MNIFTIYLILYVLFLLVFFWGGASLSFQKKASTSKSDSIKLENITVVIPFRNEERRIAPLLGCIKQSQSLPKEFIFVDDHSDDETLKLIKQVANAKIKMLSMEKTSGKKRSIEKGINAAETDYVLTLDADVSFSPHFFGNLEKLKPANLHILPVKHHCSNFIRLFFQQDVILASFLNVCISGWKRPILCSGANLLIHRHSYFETVMNPSYFEIDSGDDIFLLRAMQQKNKKIELHTESDFAVQTELPLTWNECIHQRMRWLGKAIKVGDRLANASAQIQFAFSFLNIGFLVGCLLFLPTKYALTLLFLKIFVELLFSFSYYRKNKQLGLWFFLPLYLVILPVVNGIMLFAFFGFQPKWKGRLVVQ